MNRAAWDERVPFHVASADYKVRDYISSVHFIAITAARKLADATAGSGGEKLKFVEASVQQGLTVLPRDTFDLVFISIGSLCYVAKSKNGLVSCLDF
ncbi:methyltransferase type 12 [Metarhizium brunneum]